jgi:hypothetical protein
MQRRRGEAAKDKIINAAGRSAGRSSRAGKASRTVAQAFAELVAGLAPTELEVARITRYQRVVRDALRAYTGGPKPDLLAGSFARGTAIRPFSQVDLFVVMDDVGRDTMYARGPRPTHRVLREALQHVPGAVLRDPWGFGRLGLLLEFEGGAYGFTVVPVFTHEDAYLIPGHGERRWIRGDPRVEEAILARGNERTGRMTTPLVQVVKHWNRRHDELVRSLHIERLAAEALGGPMPRFSEAVLEVFDFMATEIGRRVADPERPGTALAKEIPFFERLDMEQVLEEAAEQAERAVDLESEGRDEEAHYVWRDLLGPIYPEAGVRPKGKWP